MDDKLKYQKKLTSELNKASNFYYTDDGELMSNKEYDAKYDELLKLEKETGQVFEGSPTQTVGAKVVNKLPTDTHLTQLLSLDKTKSVEELRDWLKDKQGVLSYKLDGLTLELIYKEGELFKALTRGDGKVGEIVTHNALMIKNIPAKIKLDGIVSIIGETIITYSAFDEINKNLDEGEEEYKNPRNLASGSLRQLNSNISKNRNLMFYAFNIDHKSNSLTKRLDLLKSLKFDVTPFKIIEKPSLLPTTSIAEAIEHFKRDVKTSDLPTDGLVLSFDDIEYAKSLGQTSKFPRGSIAFKWQDETKKTILREVAWQVSRNGNITPVAEFDEVNIDGTSVRRASLHNLDIIKELKLGIGDEITVYKANMIIPQIDENLTKSDNLTIPLTCPVCDKETVVKTIATTKVLTCSNDNCPARQIKKFNYFVSKNGFDIEGLSEKTIEDFIEFGILKEYLDFFSLEKHKEKIINEKRYGEVSYENIIKSVKQSLKTVTLTSIISSLGIEGVGPQIAKIIAEHFSYDVSNIVNAQSEQLCEIAGVGEIIAKNFSDYFKGKERLDCFMTLISISNVNERIPKISSASDAPLFAVTGKLDMFKNEKELEQYITENGGRFSRKVNSKTTYLIRSENNQEESSSYKKALELKIKIISEAEIENILLGGKNE